jgi:hypothetical protein
MRKARKDTSNGVLGQTGKLGFKPDISFHISRLFPNPVTGRMPVIRAYFTNTNFLVAIAPSLCSLSM